MLKNPKHRASPRAATPSAILLLVLLTMPQAIHCKLSSSGDSEGRILNAHPLGPRGQHPLQVEPFLFKSAESHHSTKDATQKNSVEPSVQNCTVSGGFSLGSALPGTSHTTFGPGQPTSMPSWPLHLSADKSEESSPVSTNTLEEPLQSADSTPEASLEQSRPAVKMASTSSDIFAEPIGTGPPPSQIKQRKDHPAERLRIHAKGPLETNKFFSNFYMGSQASPAYLHPYSVYWAKGSGDTKSWGLAVSQIEASQRVFGEPGPSGAARYFASPSGIQHLCLSASELGKDTVLTTDEMSAFMGQISFRPKEGAEPCIRFHMLQGSGFITAIYNNCQPVLQTAIGWKTVTKATKQPKPGVEKYKLLMENGQKWLVYARQSKGNPVDLQVASATLAKAKGDFTGIVQIAKDPGGGEAVYDQACGAYATDMTLSGSVRGAQGNYSFAWKKGGDQNAKLVMFALPHHASSFDPATKAGETAVKLQTTTKGIATAVAGDKWTMVEDRMPISMAFKPWTPEKGTINSIPDAAKAVIHKIALLEAAQDVSKQSDQNSMYFSGKVMLRPRGRRAAQVDTRLLTCRHRLCIDAR